MRIMIVTSNYPSQDNPYAHMFVHERAKEYVKKGYEVVVFVPSKNKAKYDFEGVKVRWMHKIAICHFVDYFDVICIHLLGIKLPNMANDGFQILEKVVNSKLPVLWFFHGDESLSSKYYEESFSVKSFWRNIVTNTVTRVFVNKLNKRGRYAIVFPSQWFADEAQKNLKMKINNYKVIPNPIDTELFKFQGSKFNIRQNILSIRSFNMVKYANDLSVMAMYHLPEFKLTLYGKGKYLGHCKYLANRWGLTNIDFKEEFLPHELIPEKHSENGIYLSPTRMDTQGVSMCEAMSSGMPVVSTDTCAVSEFIEHNKSGLLYNYGMNNSVDSPELIAKEVRRLANDEILFNSISKNARKKAEKLDKGKIAECDLNLIKKIMK